MRSGINDLDKSTVSSSPWAVVDSSVSRWSADTHFRVGKTTCAATIPQISGIKAKFWYLNSGYGIPTLLFVFDMTEIDLSTLSSEELATRFAEAQENACFAEIERRHKRKVWAAAYSVLGDVGKAEDVAQEAFLLLSMAGDRFKGGSVEGWLSLVARRLALNLRKRHVLREEIEERFVAESPPGSLAAGTPDPRILETLATLPTEQRICLNLMYGEGLSYKEIVEKTGFSPKEVKTHLQNGRRNFKLRWEKRQRNGQ